MSYTVTTCVTHNNQGSELTCSNRFRWVELQIQNLCNRRRIKRVEDLQAELKRSPQSLSETYDRVYEEIEQQASGSPSSSRAVTERALAWMVYGKRLLSTEELLAAISVDSWGIATAVSKDQLLEMCCNLITVDPELDTFRFSHFSVREYLGARQEYSTDFGNAIAAERCLIILTNPEFGFLPGVVKPNELMQDYAIRYWAPYCHSSGQRRDQGRLAELFSSFVQRENGTVPNFENWIRILESRKTELFRSYTQKNYNSPLARLSLWARTPAFRFRIDSYLSSQLRLYDLMSMISTPADPFFAACSWDFPEIVLNSVRFDRQILKKCNLWGETGLHLSCRNGHLGVARLLTEEGASVTTRAPGIGGQDSLGFASKGGHVEVVEFLLGHEDRVFLRTSWYNRALLQAAGEGHERIASLLLRRGANANGKYLDNRVGTPLSVAPSGGHAQIVRLLIKNGANVNKSSDQ